MTADRDQWVRLAGLAELGVLTSSLIHEIRHPVFAVRATIQLAQARGDGLSAEELNDLLAHIDHMDELVRHYGGFGRPDTVPVLYDLNTPVDAALAMLAHRGRSLAATLDRDRGAQSLLVHGRESAARQVVVNLLQNAYDAVESVTDRRIAIRTWRDGEQVCLVVEDNGAGVPEGLRARLFEPFVTSKPVGRGTGLGLYIARRLVEEAGGTLDVAFPDVGTRVQVTLPRAQ